MPEKKNKLRFILTFSAGLLYSKVIEFLIKLDWNSPQENELVNVLLMLSIIYIIALSAFNLYCALTVIAKTFEE